MRREMKEIMRHFIRGAIWDVKWADQRIATRGSTPKSKEEEAEQEDFEHGFQKVRLVRQGSAVDDRVGNIARQAETWAR